MHIVYALEEPPRGFKKSIYLGGPFSKYSTTPSWRIAHAIPILRGLGYDGVVFVPEFRTPRIHLTPEEYDRLRAWHIRWLGAVDLIIAHFPRGLQAKNAWQELGEHADSGRLALAIDARHTDATSLFDIAKRRQIPHGTELHRVIADALNRLGEGAWREGGDCEVPLSIYKTASYRQWRQNLERAGHVLEHARVV